MMEYNDVIHGIINIPNHIHNIIQTPHFQRLKKIKQLGLACKTLPQANNNRFEHCIGTYYLADKTIDALEKNTKDLMIPDFYRKVVTIAALLHDIGHGPFSHTWEYICCEKYHHEENACAFIDAIFEICPIDWSEDRAYAIELIKALIVGDHKFLRDKKYRFLFDIVNNKNCDVDVDKWDYLQRDYFYTSQIQTPEVHLDFEDVFLKARVSDDRSRIEYRYCDFRKIYNIFDVRTKFHIHIYRRPINICMEKILKYVMTLCEDDLQRINGLKITDIRSQDVEAFLKLNDDEVWKSLKRIKEPEEIVQLINCLDNVGLYQIHPETDDEKRSIADHMRAEIQIPNAGESFKSENIIFYGNAAEKPTFEQEKGFHQSVTYYKMISVST
ncbi:deoxynucleoside triphosphate triphosphohydrolase SAMHD1 homolog isoform X2 [Eupeodes corollae]|uniref:deoxynucleoside triphosphate triphosphohydrolase SAMHD1 homolog isoform X2 n=1 Tax=Eupeodes corollae TaxID=290404 RepID=UPI0024918C07|nr:deoxynucleoside triphosphate triphosphohydrolase SAMHD1 homolog isoform X2 [Eupeodes corollae]